MHLEGFLRMPFKVNKRKYCCFVNNSRIHLTESRYYIIFNILRYYCSFFSARQSSVLRFSYVFHSTLWLFYSRHLIFVFIKFSANEVNFMWTPAETLQTALMCKAATEQGASTETSCDFTSRRPTLADSPELLHLMLSQSFLEKWKYCFCFAWLS